VGCGNRGTTRTYKPKAAGSKPAVFTSSTTLLLNKAGFSANSSPGSFLLTVGLAVRERSRTEHSVISGGVFTLGKSCRSFCLLNS
jgi:hypothetical protein